MVEEVSSGLHWSQPGHFSQAVEGSLGKVHPMYATILSSYADLERVTDNKPQAVALYRQALETLDALGASHIGSKSPRHPSPFSLSPFELSFCPPRHLCLCQCRPSSHLVCVEISIRLLMGASCLPSLQMQPSLDVYFLVVSFEMLAELQAF